MGFVILGLNGRTDSSRKNHKYARINLVKSSCVSPGADLLKLTREDLVQICGPADGIRLYNALKSR